VGLSRVSEISLTIRRLTKVEKGSFFRHARRLLAADLDDFPPVTDYGIALLQKKVVRYA
jgi:hypothetical protein